MFGEGLVIPEDHTQESYEDFVRIVSKASLEYDYNTLYNALWPHIKNVYKKHYNDRKQILKYDPGSYQNNRKFLVYRSAFLTYEPDE